MFRSRLRIPRAPRSGLAAPSSSSFLQSLPFTFSRGVHHLPSFEHPFNEHGVPGLLSTTGFHVAWTQYQSLMLQNLETATAGTEWENKDLKQIILNSARQPESAVLFNYASMAHNNHFFFRQLANKPVEMPENLQVALTQSFGSIETLRNEMILTARAMFGPGFVWLVQVPNPPGRTSTFKVLTTYHAGSPYSGAHWRRQSVELPTATKDPGDGTGLGREWVQKSAYGAGKKAQEGEKRPEVPPGGTDVTPILCLNTWEHVWIMDYGIGTLKEGGLKQYARAWWDVIDWVKVKDAANLTRHPMRV
ncbi:Manganese/iron superoxide dismutase [Lasiosphaeria hispida]|uniref:Manganese/iron superoxide dismutase n=1 Tax=Lasiosphaeria hispida TaxID=260671 RepID=A0AAJ0H6B3_9PEZI|nr:Manganese/iron superoxide dismutase [Lasiosphaeria hispida]